MLKRYFNVPGFSIKSDHALRAAIFLQGFVNLLHGSLNWITWHIG